MLYAYFDVYEPRWTEQNASVKATLTRYPWIACNTLFTFGLILPRYDKRLQRVL